MPFIKLQNMIRSTIDSVCCLIKIKLVTILFSYSRFFNQCKQYAKPLYDNYPVVKFVVDEINHIYGVFKYTHAQYKTDLDSKLWIKACFYYTYPKHNKVIYDDITDDYEKQLETKLIEPQLMFTSHYNMYEFNMIDLYYPAQINDAVVIMKYLDSYTVRICNPEKLDTREHIYEDYFQVSSVHFLSVQYTHKYQYTPITLVVPKGMYFCNNELFSAAFVLKCLRYQKESYYFDSDYELILIDDNVNIHRLTSKQYVMLNESSYKIVDYETKT